MKTMARENTDLISEAKSAPDIETALENTLSKLAARWRDVANRNDYGKGAAMGDQLPEDMVALIDAIMGHSQVFKSPPAVVEPCEDRLKGTPKTAERKFDREGNPINEPETKAEKVAAAKAAAKADAAKAKADAA
jgi:hypothetical protein